MWWYGMNFLDVVSACTNAAVVSKGVARARVCDLKRAREILAEDTL